MRPQTLLITILLFSSALLLSDHVNAQDPAATCAFTVNLKGSGASIGRLWILESEQILNKCELEESNTNDFAPAPLGADQQQCSFTVPAYTLVSVMARKNSYLSETVDGDIREARFVRFEGACSGSGNGSNPDAYECNLMLMPESVCNANLTAVFERIPSVTDMVPFIDSSMNELEKKLERTSLSRLSRMRSLSLGFAPAPLEGILEVKVTTRYKVKKKSRAVIQPAFSTLVLAAGKISLLQSASTNMRLVFTKKGRKFMKSSKLLRATLASNWTASGASSASIEQSQTVLLRKRRR